MEYYKNLTFNASDGEVTSKVKTHDKRKRDVGSMSSEELVLWVPVGVEMTLKELEIPISVGSLAGSTANVPDEALEMAVAGPVVNNVVGAEVVPFFMGRGVLARSVAQRTAIPPSFKKGKHVVLADQGPCSPKSVTDFAPCDEAYESVGSSISRIILFGTILAEIPTETYVVPPVAPEVEAAIVASPDEVLDLIVYSSTDFDPSDDLPTLEHVSTLLTTSPVTIRQFQVVILFSSIKYIYQFYVEI
ncbi:hypothetical protein Tco_1437693 [Tanacetum coccineum]